ncbi:prephenate dehydrogenase/arogenate dehydrogenase family protein [Streptomyces sp. CAU 1734]|uniref:prephenate dehydrogenase/arogenate dehydrogenase family protein n=1 Tax=Streptomyces sp. CAU 1734 TaxID=3140360 RepID=UPI0032611F1E
MTSASPNRVTVIGCTVTGISIALALVRTGTEVTLEDRDPAALDRALHAGAGLPLTPGHPPAHVVIIATAPGDTVDTLVEAQARGLGHTYTDIHGTSPAVRAEAELRGCDQGGYLPGHPLTGRDRPAGPDAHLLTGRTWILCPYDTTTAETETTVTALVTACGARPRRLAPTAPGHTSGPDRLSIPS